MRRHKVKCTPNTEVVIPKPKLDKYYELHLNGICINTVTHRRTAINWFKRRLANYVSTVGTEPHEDLLHIVEVKKRRIK